MSLPSSTACSTSGESLRFSSKGAGDTYFALTALGIAAKIDFKLVNLISSLASAYSVKNLSNKEYYNLTLLNKHLSHMFK